jgi:fibronectin type 3 domain-containing protein
MQPRFGAVGAAAFALALAVCGCGTTLDVEGARRALRGAQGPRPILLREEPAAALAAPEGLRAVTGELRSVPLKWDPLLAGDVGGYVIERALREKGDFQRVGSVYDRFATSYVDRGSDLAPKALPGSTDLGDGATYSYRVRAFDAQGYIAGTSTEVVTATTAPPPERPEGLRTYDHQPGKIALTWRPVSDPTIAGYVVYRSPSLRGHYDAIARLDGRYATTWVDAGLAPLRVFYYRVAAVNAAGGEGVPTRALRGVTKPEPLPPASLRVVSQSSGEVELAWDPNLEPNLAGYRVLRRRADEGEEVLVAELAPDRTSVADGLAPAGARLVYRVVAYDRDGLVSAPVEVEVATPAPPES